MHTAGRYIYSTRQQQSTHFVLLCILDTSSNPPAYLSELLPNSSMMSALHKYAHASRFDYKQYHANASYCTKYYRFSRNILSRLQTRTLC